MENFINDFKIYCENVENTEGLEIIKEHIILSFFNLEAFIDDHYNYFNDEIEEGLRLSELLESLTYKAKGIRDLDIRDTWKAFGLVQINNKLDVGDIILDSLGEAYDLLLKKYGIDRENRFLTDEIVECEKWYKDLYELEEKHFN